MERVALSAACILLLALCGPLQAQAVASAAGDQGSDRRAAAATKKTDRQAPSGSRQPKLLPGGSSETPAERSARLRRECKGRPDAGACTGYTQ